VHEIRFVPHLIYSEKIWRNPTHDSHCATFPLFLLRTSTVLYTRQHQKINGCQSYSFPYYVTLRIISFHVTNCAKIRKIFCACTTELSSCGQRFPATSRISKEGSALMIEAFKRIRRRGAKSFQRLIAMFRRNAMSTVPRLSATLLHYLPDITFLV